MKKKLYSDEIFVLVAQIIIAVFIVLMTIYGPCVYRFNDDLWSN